MMVSGKFQNEVECCSFVQISLRAKIVAGPMNVIHNLKRKLNTTILIGKTSLKYVKPVH